MGMDNFVTLLQEQLPAPGVADFHSPHSHEAERAGAGGAGRAGPQAPLQPQMCPSQSLHTCTVLLASHFLTCQELLVAPLSPGELKMDTAQ